MVRIFWAAIFLMVYNAVLASCNPKTCGLEVARCFIEIGRSKYFNEQIQCIKPHMELPDCQNFKKEMQALIQVLENYEASGKTWMDIYDKFEFVYDQGKIREFLEQIGKMIRDHPIDETQKPSPELIKKMVCCGLTEIMKILETIPENECSQGVHKLYGNLMEPASELANLTLCDAAAEKECKAYFPATKIQA